MLSKSGYPHLHEDEWAYKPLLLNHLVQELQQELTSKRTYDLAGLPKQMLEEMAVDYLPFIRQHTLSDFVDATIPAYLVNYTSNKEVAVVISKK